MAIPLFADIIRESSLFCAALLPYLRIHESEIACWQYFQQLFPQVFLHLRVKPMKVDRKRNCADYSVIPKIVENRDNIAPRFK